jgi:hypothetical protein
LDIAVLVASGEKDPLVRLEVVREGNNELVVSICRGRFWREAGICL